MAAIAGTLGLLERDFNRASTLQRLNSFGQARRVSIDTLQHPDYWAPFILIGNGL